MIPGWWWHVTWAPALFGTPIVVDFSFMLSWDFWVHACIGRWWEANLSIECAVRVLGFASDVRPPIVLLEYHPNHREHDATNMRKGDSDFEANAVGYWLHSKGGKRVYMLPQYLGIHNNCFQSFQLRSREEENTVWAVWEERLKKHWTHSQRTRSNCPMKNTEFNSDECRIKHKDARQYR